MKRPPLTVVAALLAAVFTSAAHAADGDGLTSYENSVGGPDRLPATLEQSIERLNATPRPATPDVMVDTAIAFGRLGTA
jgi:hypothetical protein